MTAPAPARIEEPATDALLVQGIVEGSNDALASLYDRHGGEIFEVAARTTGDRSVAGDVVQETFLALWDRAELFDPARGSLRGWLLAIARNRSIDHIRRVRRHDRAVAFSAVVGSRVRRRLACRVACHVRPAGCDGRSRTRS